MTNYKASEIFELDHSYAAVHLPPESSQVLSLTLADTYYPIDSVLFENVSKGGFSFDSGKIVWNYNGDTTTMNFNGGSIISTNKALVRITFALFKNFGLLSQELVVSTPLDIDVANKARALTAIDFFGMQQNDYIQAYAKSDTANTNVTLLAFGVGVDNR